MMLSGLRWLFGPTPHAPVPARSQRITITQNAAVVRTTYDPSVDPHPDYPGHAVGESHYQDALREIVGWFPTLSLCQVVIRLDFFGSIREAEARLVWSSGSPARC